MIKLFTLAMLAMITSAHGDLDAVLDASTDNQIVQVEDYQYIHNQLDQESDSSRK